MHLPSRADLEAAAEIVYRTLPPTPQYRWPILDQTLGTELWVKHENHTPAGAFKIRGGLVYFHHLDRSVNHVVCATRGNHGQSVAFAAQTAGLAATIYVPHGNSAEKNAAMRAFGADVIEHGDDFQDAREQALRQSLTQGWHLVPSFHQHLVAGVGTYSLEFLRALPQLDVVYVPIGQGSGICGLIAAREALGLTTEIVGVVSTHAPAYQLSFASNEPVSAPTTTVLADGMACRVPDPESFAIIRHHASRIIDVSDAEVAAAIRLFYQGTHNLAEGAGAAALAGALQEKSKLAGQKVGVILCGGNIDLPLFLDVMAGKF